MGVPTTSWVRPAALAVLSHWRASCCTSAGGPCTCKKIQHGHAGDPWVVNACIQFADSSTQYSVALYWSVTTITTVGYGDIVPNTNTDKTVVMLAMFFSGVLQARSLLLFSAAPESSRLLCRHFMQCSVQSGCPGRAWTGTAGFACMFWHQVRSAAARFMHLTVCALCRQPF